MTDFTEEAKDFAEEYIAETYHLYSQTIDKLARMLTAAYNKGLEDAARHICVMEDLGEVDSFVETIICALKEKP